MKKESCIVIIHPHFTIPGGAGKVILELGKRLSREYDIKIICQRANKEIIDNYPEIEVLSLQGPLTHSIFFWSSFFFWRQKTHKIIDSIKIKYKKIVVICNVFPANWIGIPYKNKNPQIPMYWYCHEPSAFIHDAKWINAIINPSKRALIKILLPLLSRYDKFLTKKTDKIFANSIFTQRNIKKTYKRESIVIYPGVDSEKFLPIEFNKKKDYILTVGRLTKFKRIDILINTLKQLKNKKIILKVVGDGEEKMSLLALTKKLNLENRVEFISGISDEDLVEIYAKAKIFILASKNEPFGIVPIEAMASGTMVIADNSGGPKEIIDHNKNGILINDMKCSELTIILDNLFSTEKVISDLSKNTRLKVINRFTWDNSVKEISKQLWCISISLILSTYLEYLFY